MLALRGRDLQRYRGDVVSMVYQNPGTALNPSIRVGKQLGRGVHRARLEQAPRRSERSLAMLRQVQIADPTSVMERYPHQLSGGMQQRVVIAMALGVDPALLILDEPTTGLDATVEAEVLDLITKLQAEFHTAVLFISHNLGVIRKMCSRVGVLYAGEMVEEGDGRAGPARPPAPVHRRPAALHPARRRAQGPRPAGHDSRATCRRSAPICRAASSPTAARSPRTSAAPRSRRSFPVGGGHISRCFFHERAQELPRAMAADLEGAGARRPHAASR